MDSLASQRNVLSFSTNVPRWLVRRFSTCGEVTGASDRLSWARYADKPQDSPVALCAEEVFVVSARGPRIKRCTCEEQ